MPNWYHNKQLSPFDPEGSGYDDETARRAGLKPDKTNHMPSRVPSGPDEGQILKGKKHETFHKTVKGEKEAGYEKFKSKNKKYYSREKRGKGM